MNEMKPPYTFLVTVTHPTRPTWKETKIVTAQTTTLVRAEALTKRKALAGRKFPYKAVCTPNGS